MEPSEFCVIIMSHGRADRVRTIGTLRRNGCTSEIVILIDDEDSQADEYFERYDGRDGCRVVRFCKREVAETVDVADVIPDRMTVLFARNHSYEVASSLGYRYFILLEDDYESIDHRWIELRNGAGVLRGRGCGHLDQTFGVLLDFLKECPRLECVCLAQGGDYIGGADSFASFNDARFRKAMNTFACATDRPNRWYGRLNDDVNGYVVNGMRGAVYITMRNVAVVQTRTQGQGEGMTEVYKRLGTYAKSFYSVMMCPSAVGISAMGWHNMRVHHEVEWRYAVPQIVSSRHRRSDTQVEPMEAIW